MLVIDDDVKVAQIVCRILREHDVVALHSGVEAVALLTSGAQFDVILCDVMMPNMSGMEVHEALARAVPDALPRLVFITGGAFTPATMAFLDRVPNALLKKPFDIEALKARVQQVVQVGP